MNSLRNRLATGEILVVPGAADALSARLIEQQGFEAIYLSGAGVSYTLLGQPDVGLVNQMEMSLMAFDAFDEICVYPEQGRAVSAVDVVKNAAELGLERADFGGQVEGF